MARIVPKLNLNKTPAIVENNSLVFAKNIRADVDGSIHKDYGIFSQKFKFDYNGNIFRIYKSFLKRIKRDILYQLGTVDTDAYNYFYNIFNNGESLLITGVITNGDSYFLFLRITDNTHTYKDVIVEYEENVDRFKFCNCNWTYSRGNITGCLINNLYGERILIVAESFDEDTDKRVPLKCINLTKSSYKDDDSIYTQMPNIPITNLLLAKDLNYTIPNGTYQFFVRYKIREGFYTSWFPASKECFATNKEMVATNYGVLKQVNIHTDSHNSFVFNVEHLYNEYTKNYESFQIGFLLSHDDTTYARAWKHFNFSQNVVNFDYKAEDAEEIEVTDLLESGFQLYNVKNITNFKNKLYISNYIESELDNSNLEQFARNITIAIEDSDNIAGYEYEYEHTTIGGYKTAVRLRKTVSEGETPQNYSDISGNVGIISNIVNSIIGSKLQNIITDFETAKTDNANVSNKNFNITGKLYYNSIQNAINEIHHDYAEEDVEIDDVQDVKAIYIGSDCIYEKTGNIGLDNTSAIEKVNIIKQTIYNSIKGINLAKGKLVDINGTICNSFKIRIVRTCHISVNNETTGGGNTDPSNPDEPGTNSPIIGSHLGIGSPTFGSIHKDDTFKPPTTIGNDAPTTIAFQSSGVLVDKDVDYDQNIYITFSVDMTELSTEDLNFLNSTTLIPYQKYDIYVHYVKQNGEITNGYFCNKIVTNKFYETVEQIIYPKFDNIQAPNGYVACFFSIRRAEKVVSTIYDIDQLNANDSNVDAEEGSVLGYVGHSIDINTRMFPNSNEYDVICKNETSIINTSARFFDSNDTSKVAYFGANGILEIDTDEDSLNDIGYIVQNYIANDDENVSLIKCTPFIKLNANTPVEYNNYKNLNLLGYICQIYPLNTILSQYYYNDGSNVYLKELNRLSASYLPDVEGNIEENITEPGGSLAINLKYLSDYKNDTSNPKLDHFTRFDVGIRSVNIYSNYNFNAVTLSEDPKIVFKTIYDGDGNINMSSSQNEDTSSSNTSVKKETRILKLIPSLTMTDVYTLPKMYHDYTRKTFAKRYADTITKYDNTVRSSEYIGDEERMSIFVFKPEDYYNVPTNRGEIVNLIAVGDNILVHTRDSLFKFTGSNNLQSTQGEIKPSETNPFDTGVAEVFGSDFGFAGIQNKNDYIMIETAYVFFDRSTTSLYMYAGNDQISNVGNNIFKLLRRNKVLTVALANDYYNNRFFLSLGFADENSVGENNTVTLSFSLLPNIKDFISLHDIYFFRAFNTKNKCYFVNTKSDEICTLNKNIKYCGCYNGINLIRDEIYPIGTPSTLQIGNPHNPLTEAEDSYVNVLKFKSIIDVINNSNYEFVKTLNSLEWQGNSVLTEYENIDSSDITTYKLAEDFVVHSPCSSLMVYSDICISETNDFSGFTSNDGLTNDGYGLSADSYKKPRYNQGKWAFNYFRDLQNGKPNYTYNDGRNNNTNLTYRSDNNSLIEGKYFVARFTFDNEFKFETIFFNYNNKL